MQVCIHRLAPGSWGRGEGSKKGHDGGHHLAGEMGLHSWRGEVTRVSPSPEASRNLSPQGKNGSMSSEKQG